MRTLKRLKRSINTILLFIRALEIAYLVLQRKEKRVPQQKKNEEDSIMGKSKTIISSSSEEIAPVKGKPLAKAVDDEETIDYEAESIPLETTEISFESLEELDSVIRQRTGLTKESKETLNKLEGTEIGFYIKDKISSLLDQAELIPEQQDKRLKNLSALLD